MIDLKKRLGAEVITLTRNRAANFTRVKTGQSGIYRNSFIASYRGKLAERFPIWRDSMKRLAKLANVNVKVGGLAMPFW